MIAIILYYYIYIIIYRWKTKTSRREGRERTRAKDTADIFASSSPLFCSVCFPHRPHHRQPLTTSPACVSAHGEGRAATSSASGRCHRHTSPPPRQRPESTGQRIDGLPFCPPRPRLSSPPSGGEGRATSQPGRAIPLQLTPSTLSALSRCLGIYADTSGDRGGVCQAISGRRGSSVRFKVSGIFARLYRSKYQLFIFSEGFGRAKPAHRGNSNYT